MNISYKISSLKVAKLQGSNFAKFLHQALNTLDFIEGILFFIFYFFSLTNLRNHFHSHNTFVIFFSTEYGFRTHLTILMRDSSFPLSLGVSAEDVGFEPTHHISDLLV